MSRTHAKRVLIGVWAIAIVLGAVGVIWRLVSEQADFGSRIPWGLWVAVYAWFVGVAAGAYMLFAAGELFRIERLRRIGRPMLVIAFASLLSGLVVVGLDLGRWERFWHVYVYGDPSSLVAWEISFYTAFTLLLLVVLVLAFRNELARFGPFSRLAGPAGVDSPWIRPLALVGGVLALAVSGATGALFGVVGSAPYWNTGLVPLLFIATALLSAAAVVTAFAALTSDERHRDPTDVSFLGRLTLAFLALTVLIEWADVSIAWASQPQAGGGWPAWDLVLSGPNWWVFWFVHLAAGVVIPALLLLLRPRSIAAVGAAAALVAVTLVSVRLNIVIPGLAVPRFEGLKEAYTGPGLTFTYAPTLQEWLVSLFAGAVFVGLVGLWYRFVPARLQAPAQPDALPAGSAGAETRAAFLGKAGIAGGALLASQLPLALHGLDEPGGGTDSPLGSRPDALAPVPDVPAPVQGEDPVIRMMEDVRRALAKPIDQRRWIMVIDLRKCTGCIGCTIACVTENKLPPGIAYRPVLVETRGTYPNVSRRFIPRPCMQCEKPPCTPVCPVGATWRREDGIVVIDYDRCIGCRYCIAACPYGARSSDRGDFYSDFEGGDPQPYETVPADEYGVERTRTRDGSPVGNARKCHFCIHRIEKGELPACVVSCMGRATFFGDANDSKSLVSELISQPNVMRLKEELGTEPKVYYLT